MTHYMHWTKRAYQSIIFRLLSVLMKVHPIPHAIFETARSRSIQILNHSLVSWQITSLHFLAQTLCTLDKKSPSKEPIFILLRGWVKIHPVLHVVFETTSQSFFKLCITLQRYERHLVCTFLAETLYDLDKRAQKSAKLQTFDSSHKISPS